MSVRTITPQQARALMRTGALLVDIRNPDEHEQERIADATLIPLGQVGAGCLPAGTSTVIFHCRSGMRTGTNADRLMAAANCEVYLLEGGLNAWKQAGLPVIAGTSGANSAQRKPLELQRQVQLSAGLLVLAGVGLGATVASEFQLLAAFVGAGLTFAGLTGKCLLATVLKRMPWNRGATANP